MDELEKVKAELNERLSNRTKDLLGQIGELKRELDYTKTELKALKKSTQTVLILREFIRLKENSA